MSSGGGSPFGSGSGFPLKAPGAGAPSDVRHISGSGYTEPGCVVSCIAMVAGTDYAKARSVAASVAGFDGTDGLSLRDVPKVFDKLGVSATHHEIQTTWSELPDFAIITVHGRATEHAVVFRRQGGKEYIYDWQRSGPVLRSDADYSLRKYSSYLEIHK
ncbi:MAG TPA: hypothetical protein VFP68_17970 [Burkholderiaceae bacterium]|nr:hypothetical protein [Burkholderiaceae bacterium]